MLTNQMGIITERTVPLEKLALYDDIQMRVRLPHDTIAQYAKDILTGTLFPEIECAELDGELIVYNGFLRKMAYAKAAISQIKVRVRKAESRDQIVLWAVQSDAHVGRARSNKDKQYSVRQLLNTELGRSMSAVDIAKAAGVERTMVRRFREHLETNISKSKALSDSPQKVKTPRGMRPRKYNTKKQKKERGKSATLFSPKINWPTREQIGAPPPELENQPHPDHPGLTYSQVFVRQHGNVQMFSLDERRRQDALIAMREVAGYVRDLGEICDKLLAALEKTSLQAVFELLGSKDGTVSLRKIETGRANIDKAFPIVKAILNGAAIASTTTVVLPNGTDDAQAMNGKNE